MVHWPPLYMKSQMFNQICLRRCCQVDPLAWRRIQLSIETFIHLYLPWGAAGALYKTRSDGQDSQPEKRMG
jgi:hypothetical protein